MGLFESLFMLFVKVIAAGGYWGVFVLMTLESMVAPVPSEAVMPFAGYLVATGNLDMTLVVVSSGFGSIVGSLVSYYVGFKGGKPVVLKFGKYLLLDVRHLEMTERFFAKYGEKTIFICRFIPVVRHLISVPAGIGKMNIARFSIYTVVGATIWNAILAYAGMWLGEQWSMIHHYLRYLDILVILLGVTAVVYFVRKRLRERQVRASGELDDPEEDQ